MAQPALNILIVDDDDGDRKLIRRILSRSGLKCDCTEAVNLDEALAAFTDARFDCVILDYYLPGESGLDGVPAFLQHDPFVAIIMSTGQGNEQIASQAIKLGALDYVSKAELTSATIRVAVDSAVERSNLNRAIAEQRKALEVFARVVVHDMKAPTQSILGFAKLIEAFLRDDRFDREKIVAQSNRIVEGAQRMNRLLDQLHTYTQADAQPKFEKLLLDKLIGDVLANLDSIIRSRRVHFHYDHLPMICGDHSQLSQLFQNLISNGIKYCQAEEPEIAIQAEHQRESGDCVVEIRDNGIGIPREHWDDIFEPFKRLHSNGDYEGTGLGLATCKKIVERHGGEIWCRSRPGEGTSFFFSLPAVESTRPVPLANAG